METVFSNALTSENLGAAAGGADFNPHNKSEAEIQRCCSYIQCYFVEHRTNLVNTSIQGENLQSGNRVDILQLHNVSQLYPLHRFLCAGWSLKE